MITWNDSFSTGMPQIDAQHKKLIEKYNEFYGATLNGAGREAAGGMLDFLQFYATWHFGREEACMEEYHCPVAAKNKQAHAYFIEQFSNFYEEWQTNTMTRALVLETYHGLGRWIENHILHIDVELNGCAHGQYDLPEEFEPEYR